MSLIQSSKIQSVHLSRLALIYVRQSTLAQVRDNIGSTARQYDLIGRAVSLGWPRDQVVVVDQDQGCSGASTEKRDGFKSMLAEVGLGRVGAIFSIEVSRFARDNSDWHQLLKICGMAGTLVIDESEIRDPSIYDDRLLLGIKGTLSEAELQAIRFRLEGGKRKKAENGSLRVRLPVGFVYAENGEPILDSDQEVQEIIRLIFNKFEQCGSAMGVVRYLVQNKLRLPARKPNGELQWASPDLSRIAWMLHNPVYAGAYVYGQSEVCRTPIPDEPLKFRAGRRTAKASEWKVLIRDAHVGYISWEQFQRNVRQLDDNRTTQKEGQRGMPREGRSLLQGIVVCGRCGGRMCVAYTHNAKTLQYVCRVGRCKGARTCQSISGSSIDAEVARILLQTVAPAHIETSLSALDEIFKSGEATDHQWQLCLERAEYEADLARRRYQKVDPENRLVARNLEAEWNERLKEVDRLRREYVLLPKQKPQCINSDERHLILALSQNLAAVWNSSVITNVERKQLIRLVINKVELLKKEDEVNITIHWRTGATTITDVHRPSKGDSWRNPADLIAIVLNMGRGYKAQQIADHLNAAGYKTGKNCPITADAIYRIRRKDSVNAERFSLTTATMHVSNDRKAEFVQ